MTFKQTKKPRPSDYLSIGIEFYYLQTILCSIRQYISDVIISSIFVFPVIKRFSFVKRDYQEAIFPAFSSLHSLWLEWKIFFTMRRLPCTSSLSSWRPLIALLSNFAPQHLIPAVVSFLLLGSVGCFVLQHYCEVMLCKHTTEGRF